MEKIKTIFLKIKHAAVFATKFGVYIIRLSFWKFRNLIKKRFPKLYAKIITIKPIYLKLGFIILVLGIIGAIWISPKVYKYITTPRPPAFSAAPKNSGYQFQAYDGRNRVTSFVGVRENNDPTIEAKFRGGQTASFALTEIDINISKPVKSGNSITFKNVRNDVDLKYETLVSGIKESLIIKSPQKGNAFTYALNTSKASPKLIANNIYSNTFYDDAGNFVFGFIKPFAFDAKGERTDNLVLSIEKAANSPSFTVRVVVNQKWLEDPARVYPITIDPTITYNTTSLFSPGTFDRTVDTGSGDSPNITTNYQELAADQNTAGLWHMNETSGNVIDSSGNGLTGTPNGASVTDGKFGKGRSFINASNDAITFTSTNVGPSYTMEGWINFPIPNNANWRTIFANNGGTYHYALVQAGANNLGVYNNTFYSCGFDVTSINGWHHLALVVQPGVSYTQFYLDGNPICQSATQITNQNFGIIGNCATYCSQGMGTTIDEVRFSKVARSPEEIRMDAQRRPYGVYTSDVMSSAIIDGTNQVSWSELGVTTGDGETLANATNLVAQWNFNSTSGTTATNDAGAGTCGGTPTNCDFTLNNFASTGSQDVSTSPGSGWTANNKRWGAGALMLSNAATADNLSRADPAGNVLDPNSSDFSVETWIKTNSPAGGEVISNNNANGASCTNNGWRWGISATTGTPVFRFDDNGATAGCDVVITSPKSIIDGRWHLVTITVTRGDNAVMYVDGIPVGSDTVDSYSNITVTGSLYMGGSTGVLNATVDSTRFYTRALPASEVAANYNAANIELQTRVGDTTDPNDGTWEDWKPVANETQIQSLNADQSNWAWDLAATYMPKTKADDSTIKVEGSGSMNLTTGIPQVDANTVGLWHLDETGGSGAYIKDSTANANNGTPTGTTVINGIAGKARSFNGTSDYISVDNNSSLNQTSAISVSAWFKTTDTAGGLISKRSGNNGYRLIYSGGSLYWTVGNGSTIVQPTTSGYNDGNWHLVEGTYNGTNAILYVDGISKSSITLAGPMTNTASALLIGDSDDQGKLAGTLDEIRISNIARTPEEIAEDYRLGRGHTLNRTINATDLSSIQKLAFNVSADRPGTYLETTIGNNTFANYQPDANTLGLWHLDDNSSGTTPPAPSPSLWVKADAINGLTDGAAVSSWADSSGNGRNMTQGTGSKQPIYKTNIVNGLPVVRFSAASAQQLTNATNFTTPVTVFYVAKQAGTGNQRVLTSVNNNWLLGYWSGAKNQAYFEGWVTASGSPSTDTAWHVFSAVETGSLSSVYADGSSVASNANGVAGPNALSVGCWQSGGECSDVDVAEIIVYSSALSAADRAAVESYLGSKYGIDVGTISSYSAKDSSGNGNNGSTVGTTFTTQGKIGGARVFNGSSDKISMPLVTNAVSSVSLEAWFLTTDYTADRQVIVNNGSGANGYGIFINTEGESTGELRVLYGGVAWYGTGKYITDAKWHHVVLNIMSDKHPEVYLDGQLIYVGGVNNPATPTANTYIGTDNSGAGTPFFKGNIDEVRISNATRSASDIRAAYEYGIRSHEVTIDFGAKLDSSNLITGSGDKSFTVDATYYGLSNKGSNLYTGDKIIVRENYDGTTYTVQGTVNGVVASTGAVTVTSWDNGSTFPSSGFSVNADVFKWQREYFDITGILSTQRNAVTNLTFRETNGNEGRNIWVDNIQSIGSYLTNPAGSDIASSTGKQYFQYRTVFSSNDYNVSSSLSSTTSNFTSNAPNAPVMGAPSDITTTSVTWNFTGTGGGGVEGVVGYKIVDTTGAIKATCAGAVTSCTETAMTPNTSNIRKIVAYNSAGLSPYSTIATAITLAAVPEVPTTSSPTATSLVVVPNYGTNSATTDLAMYQETGTDCDGSGGYYLKADGTSNGSDPVWLPASSWGNIPVSSLDLETYQYSFCTKARNLSDGQSTAWSGGNSSGGGYTGEVDDFTMAGNMSFTEAKRKTDGNDTPNFTRKIVGLDFGPVGWWKLDDSSGNAADSSGNNLTLTNSNVSYISGKYGLAGSFSSASSTKFSCTDNSCGGTTSSRLDFTATQSFSFGGWFNTSTTGTNKVIISKKSSVADASAGYSLIINTSNFPVCRIADGTNLQVVNTAPSIADSNWHHVVCVVNRSTQKLTRYVDGVVSGTPADISGVASLDNTTDFKIGADAGNYFNGSIDDVRVYRTTLSQHDIQVDMGASSPQNVSKFRVKSGTLTLLPDQTMSVGELILTGGSIAATPGAQIKIGSPVWYALSDQDGDGYTVGDSSKAYAGSQPANGKRKFLGPPSGLDCNDSGTNSANVYTSATCYVDADNDDYGVDTTRTCIGVPAHTAVTCATATWASLGEGTAASAQNVSSVATDCYDNNPNAFPKTQGTGYCGLYRGQTADGAIVTDNSSAGNSYDYDCSTAPTTCTPIKYSGYYEGCQDLGSSCGGSATFSRSNTPVDCGVTGYDGGDGWSCQNSWGCDHYKTTHSGIAAVNGAPQTCR